MIAVALLATAFGLVAGFAVGHTFLPPAPNTDTTNLRYCYHNFVNSKDVPPPFNQFFHGDNGTYEVFICRVGP